MVKLSKIMSSIYVYIPWWCVVCGVLKLADSLKSAKLRAERVRTDTIAEISNTMDKTNKKYR